MQNITIHRYSEKDDAVYAAAIQPADHTWILYVRRDGKAPELHTDRDPTTGAVRSLKQHLPARHAP